MNIQPASSGDLRIVHGIVTHTIQAVYPRYYPGEVVEFFLNHHREENILIDLQNGKTYLVTDNQKIVGTGSLDKNHITRVFVLPEHQGKGYGTYLMDYLEGMIAKDYPAAILDASQPAMGLYLKRGYITTENLQIVAAHNRVLCYPAMQKLLPFAEASPEEFSYDGRTFLAVENSENGEVSQKTIFRYHQNDDTVWAEYSGGEISKGLLIGKVQNGGLSFTYQHINHQGRLRMGKCLSRPQLLPDGRLRLNERWQWLNGDCTAGSSIVEEIPD
ncbi:GNAT family N-acetyltransferase [Acetanaerobacterium elongatum]|uniref:Ribosomal protein S18 acetylase RimI n=1 Tax=Acetanaerobacterium elongatum TaxID=258515 RepID=A0A1H0A378_9FIRM|nr:GNAT family N-acetyltransferase [Acetanaerobacterium elongatum]SDN28282.1 Ribosomal protein S18 acetylase RimI [Acetanaerobacterium elongatum]